MELSEPTILQRSRAKIFSQIGLACFVILAATAALQVAVNYLTYYFAPELADQSWYLWAATFIPLYVVGVPVGIALFRRIPTDKALPRKLRFKDLLIFLVMCFPVMYVGNLVGTLLSSLLHMLAGTEAQNPLDAYLGGANVWLSLLFMVLLAPVVEEFIFRKLIIDRIRPFGEAVSVLVSALFFGLFHGNVNQFFYAFGLGAIFAFLYVKTGRLRYPVFLHMTINLLGGVLAPLLLKSIDLNALAQMSGRDPREILQYAAAYLPQLMALGLYSMVYLALVIAGFVLLIVRRRAFFFEYGPLQLQRGTGFKTIFLNTGVILFIVAALALFALSLL